MTGHYIELAVNHGEAHIEFTCTHQRGDQCHKTKPGAESWDGDDPELIDTDECWAMTWWENEGDEALRIDTTAAVLARVPVDIAYDEGILTTPTALATVTPNPNDARQVETVARVEVVIPFRGGTARGPIGPEGARAVLTALAALAASPKAGQSGEAS